MYESATPTFLGGWSRDGKFLVYHDGKGIFAFSAATHDSKRLIESSYDKDEPHLSPDGQWVAYNSHESGSIEVYVASFPTFESRRQVSLGGGGVAWWRDDGGELFYMSPDGKIMSVAVLKRAGLLSEFRQHYFRRPSILRY